NFTTGKTHSFGGQHLELMPPERIRLTDRFDDPNLPGEIQLTVTLKKVSVGRIEHPARRCAGRHSRGGLLSRMARVALAPGQARRSRNSGLARLGGGAVRWR